MHKSRLGVIVIDCESDDLSAAEKFWSQALGYAVQRSDNPEHDNYSKLETPESHVGVLLQKVDHQSRVHLDIETDDVEAEVQRLEKLGARKVKKLPRWWVMEAPSGHRFCVVNPQRGDFEVNANQWD
jgi:predicted enzyme related to lactoylglutathione lyase